MKIRNLLFTSGLTILFSHNCFSQDKAVITGKVKNATGKEISLNNLSAKLDSSGFFKFEFDVQLPDLFTLKYAGKVTELFLEPKDKIEIDFDALNIYSTITFIGTNAFIQEFLSELAIINNQQSEYFNLKWSEFISLPEKEYIQKVEFFRAQLQNPLEQFISKHQGQLNEWFIKKYRLEIKFGYDRLVYNYFIWHNDYKTKNDQIEFRNQHINIEEFSQNDADLLKIDNYYRLMKDIIRIRVLECLQTDSVLKKSDNKWITAYQRSVIKMFSNDTIRNYWLHYYLLNHIEGCGVKNLEGLIDEFNNYCTNDSYKKEINEYYQKELKNRQNHIIKTYKEIDGYKLDAHIFIPNDIKPDEKRPAILYFHGGGYYTGKPDWHFGFDRNGFVSISFEYRIGDRHETTPFEAISDAKSAIRWVRQNALELQVDTNKIIASGNSCGAAMVIATALLDSLDEPFEYLTISSKPNAMILNASGYDQTNKVYSVKDKNSLARISGINLVKPNASPCLVIHGTKDNAIPFDEAKVFVTKMRATGNLCEFMVLEGAGHVPWLYPPYSKEANKARQDFLKMIGYIK